MGLINLAVQQPRLTGTVIATIAHALWPIGVVTPHQRSYPDQPREKVVATIKACTHDAGVGGGYVCSSSNSIHSGVDPELYRTMVQAIHKYGRYPLDMDALT